MKDIKGKRFEICYNFNNLRIMSHGNELKLLKTGTCGNILLLFEKLFENLKSFWKFI